jgi:hypothetical protein
MIIIIKLVVAVVLLFAVVILEVCAAYVIDIAYRWLCKHLRASQHRSTATHNPHKPVP